MRKPLQGVLNIVRFNWHFYVAALVGVGAGLCLAHWLGGSWWGIGQLVALMVLLTTLVSLVVSWYVYDYSDLYTFSWLPELAPPKVMVNINAGFDETSPLLAKQFPQARLRVLDFYDPALHTEVSIKRARRAYGVYPGTVSVTTKALMLTAGSVDLIFLVLAAHEIRDDDERGYFFNQIRGALKPGGKVVVVEHLRDLPNFLAYSLGAFHFLPLYNWRQTFAAAGFPDVTSRKINPFVTTFILTKHVATP